MGGPGVPTVGRPRESPWMVPERGGAYIVASSPPMTCWIGRRWPKERPTSASARRSCTNGLDRFPVVVATCPLDAVSVRGTVWCIVPSGSGQPSYAADRVGTGCAWSSSRSQVGVHQRLGIQVLLQTPSLCTGVPASAVTHKFVEAERLGEDLAEHGKQHPSMQRGKWAPSPADGDVLSLIDAATLTRVAQATADALAPFLLPVGHVRQSGTIDGASGSTHGAMPVLYPDDQTARLIEDAHVSTPRDGSYEGDPKEATTHETVDEPEVEGEMQGGDIKEVEEKDADVGVERKERMNPTGTLVVVHCLVTASASELANTIVSMSPVGALLPMMVRACAASLMAAAIPLKASPVCVPVVRYVFPSSGRW